MAPIGEEKGDRYEEEGGGGEHGRGGGGGDEPAEPAGDVALHVVVLAIAHSEGGADGDGVAAGGEE